MNSMGMRTREIALDLLTRLLVGGGIAPEERARVRSEMRLSGFRNASRNHLLRRMMRAGLAGGDVRILAPALEGLFTIACSALDSGVGWAILEHGTYEPHVVACYRRRLRPGMTVVDIGANIGFHALHAAVLVGEKGSVIAVEPDPGNIALLDLSLSVNGPLLAIELIEAAASDAPGELVESDLGNASNSGARFTHKDRAVLERLVHGEAPLFRTVPALRWDDRFLDRRIDFVKIDIEGYEPAALRGMEQSLARHRPVVLSEFAPSNLRNIGGISSEEYLAWFRDRRYSCAVLDEKTGEEIHGDAVAIASGLAGRHHIDLVFTP